VQTTQIKARESKRAVAYAQVGDATLCSVVLERRSGECMPSVQRSQPERQAAEYPVIQAVLRTSMPRTPPVVQSRPTGEAAGAPGARGGRAPQMRAENSRGANAERPGRQASMLSGQACGRGWGGGPPERNTTSHHPSLNATSVRNQNASCVR